MLLFNKLTTSSPFCTGDNPAQETVRLGIVSHLLNQTTCGVMKPHSLSSTTLYGFHFLVLVAESGLRHAPQHAGEHELVDRVEAIPVNESRQSDGVEDGGLAYA